MPFVLNYWTYPQWKALQNVAKQYQDYNVLYMGIIAY